jgi:hypothetical protein
MVVAREGDQSAKVLLANRFQEAIDEAAMRLGSIDSGSYLDGWRTGEWLEADGAPADVVANISQALEAEFDQEALTTILDALGTTD